MIGLRSGVLSRSPRYSTGPGLLPVGRSPRDFVLQRLASRSPDTVKHTIYEELGGLVCHHCLAGRFRLGPMEAGLCVDRAGCGGAAEMHSGGLCRHGKIERSPLDNLWRLFA